MSKGRAIAYAVTGCLGLVLALVLMRPMGRIDANTLMLKRRLMDADLLLTEREALGDDVRCARQIWRETKWLVGAKVDRPRALERLSELEDAMAGAVGTQCFTEWFWRLDDFSDRVFQGEDVSDADELLGRINTPDSLTAYLNSILISRPDVPGENHRKELNVAVSALTRLIVRKQPETFSYHPELENALLTFMNDVWQDPTTGYFGPWVAREGQAIEKKNDLSITFHIVTYRNGDVPHWPEIFETTLRIRDADYPEGWREEGGFSYHHAYDVTRILRLGWPHATPKQQEDARAALGDLLDTCLREGLTSDGSVRPDPAEDSVGERYFFAVAFLVQVGHLGDRPAFWGKDPAPDADEIRARIRAQIRSIAGDAPKDYMFRDALALLESPELL